MTQQFDELALKVAKEYDFHYSQESNALAFARSLREEWVKGLEPVAWCLEVYDFAEMVTDREIYTEQVKGNAIPLYTLEGLK